MEDLGKSCTPLKYDNITRDQYLAYAAVRADFQKGLANIINRLTGDIIISILTDKVEFMDTIITVEYYKMDRETIQTIVLELEDDNWKVKYRI